MVKNVLITGGNGFIGSYVVEKLLLNNYNCVLLKRKTSDLSKISPYINKLKFYDIEVTSLPDIFKAEKINAVVHLSTKYVKIDSFEEIDEIIDSNIKFASKLLFLAVQHGVKYFFNTGTFFEYKITKLPVSESSDKTPFNVYAYSKIAFEEMLKLYSEKYDIKSITYKIFSPYGPRDTSNKLLPYIMKSHMNKKSIRLSHGLQKMDFVYSEDIADAYLKGLQTIDQIPANHTAINIGGGFPYSIRDVVSLIEEITNEKLDVIWGKPEQNDMQITYADISIAKNLLNWQPKHNLYEGLKKTISYYKNEA